MRIELTIGWTMSDLKNGYSSFDGYQPGARQHTETVEVEVDWEVQKFTHDVEWAVLELAEAAFVATNHPNPESLTGLPGETFQAIRRTGYIGREAGHYSLSVGDTVTVAEVTLACAPYGWERVRHTTA